MSNSLSRRDFVSCLAKIAVVAGLSNTVGCSNLFAPSEKRPFSRLKAVKIEAKESRFNDGRRPIGGLCSFEVSRNRKDCRLYFEDSCIGEYSRAEISFTTGVELFDTVRISAFVANESEPFGDFVMCNSFSLQPWRLKIDAPTLKKVVRYGLELAVSGGKSDKVHFLKTFRGINAVDANGLLPHLLIFGNPCEDSAYNVFEDNLYSLNSLNPFGWMEGCLLEGLSDAAQRGQVRAKKALQAHTEFFFENGSLSFDSYQSRKMSNGAINSLEDLLPFAHLARTMPDNICIARAKQWILNYVKNPKRKEFTTEGCYTLAYPLMEMARIGNDAKCAEYAIGEILKRDAILRSDIGDVSQRGMLPDKTGLKNWSRGVAWYILGIVKTLQSMRRAGFANVRGANDVKKALNLVVGRMLGLQTQEGFWYCFADDAATLSEASGTAGIAAGLAIGYLEGLLPEEAATAAKRAVDWFFTAKNQDNEYLNITADGFSRNTTQSNRLGDAFQRSGKRVIMQVSSGLIEQARIALADISKMKSA